MYDMKVLFATSNKNKVKEANEIGKLFNIVFRQIDCRYTEIRDENVENVAVAGAEFAYKKIKKPVIVEDSGVYIDALDGFPGAYSKFVFNRIGNAGILNLMANIRNRNATFISAIAYRDSRVKNSFSGKVNGIISKKILGNAGFGYDPIFIPRGYKKTFAQDSKFKNKISHRKIAVEKFCRWLKNKNNF